MSFKTTHLLAFLFLVICAYEINAASIPRDDNDELNNRKCVVEQSFFDGCNTCTCVGNKQDKGVWRPMMACTYMSCSKPDGPTFNFNAAPPEFWEK